MSRVPALLPPLCAWVVAGAVFDTVAVVGIWLLLEATGPLNQLIEEWLCAIGLMAVPWCVHVVALPRFFRVSAIPKVDPAALLLRGILFIAAAATLVPFFGVCFSLLIGLLLHVILTGGSFQMSVALPTWADHAFGIAFSLLIPTLAGAATGVLLHVMRAGDLTSDATQPHKPSAYSDILGGAIAALLIFAGIEAALPLGLLSQRINIPTDRVLQLAMPPQLPSSVLIITLAMLPHLLMSGREILGFSTRECTDI